MTHLWQILNEDNHVRAQVDYNQCTVPVVYDPSPPVPLGYNHCLLKVDYSHSQVPVRNDLVQVDRKRNEQPYLKVANYILKADVRKIRCKINQFIDIPMKMILQYTS